MIPLLIVFINLWVYKILSFSYLIGVLVLASSIFVFYSYKTKKVNPALIFIFIILSLVQFKTTNIKSLTNLSEDQKVIQTRRLKEYPPTFINIFGKIFWIPAAHIFEERNEYMILDRLTKNFSEVIDLNHYFFASHPRETDSIESFEKFSYILLPFFLVGFITLLIKKNFWLLLLIFIVPVFMSTLIGTRNPIGPITLFPLFALSIYCGINFVYEKVKAKDKIKLSILFTCLYLLVFVQTFIYAIN